MSSSGVLVVARPPRLPTMFERLGSEIVILEVGQEGHTFSVHKKLLVDASEYFASVLSQPAGTNGRYHIIDLTPELFTLVFNYLYSNELPSLKDQEHLGDDAKARHLKVVCQLYAFGEKFKLKNDFLNKLMDEIQDGFRHFDRLPEPRLIENIYKNTEKDSKLRVFCAYSLVYFLQTSSLPPDFKMGRFLNEIPDLLDDFLSAVRNATATRLDTRIRSCGMNPKCAHCHSGVPHTSDGQTGFFSCWFHVHSPGFSHYRQDSAGNWEENRISDECYLNVDIVRANSGM